MSDIYSDTRPVRPYRVTGEVVKNPLLFKHNNGVGTTLLPVLTTGTYLIHAILFGFSNSGQNTYTFLRAPTQTQIDADEDDEGDIKLALPIGCSSFNHPIAWPSDRGVYTSASTHITIIYEIST